MSDELDSLNQSNNARRVNLAAWRARRLHDLELPSGLDVTVRDVSMTDLLFTGKLPAAMLDFAQDASQNGSASVDLKEMAKNGADFKALMDEIVRLCLVEPPIGDVEDDEHITLAELSGDDKMFIFNWANREVEQVRSFREGEAQPVAAVQPGNGNGSAGK
jgi:hypothetical protein